MDKLKIELYTKGRSNHYYAKALYVDGKVIVLAGSKIAINTTEKKFSKLVAVNRNDKHVVGSDMILKKDVEFTSSSLAAQFVTSNISNGLRVWRTNAGQTLKSYLNGENVYDT
ncbi:DUF4357 domain-containing protein [Paenibacillus sp. RS8]|uniref:DUF4357 domain-containing protein n=1 Tax=Paenibacillus sp. RS8 TaxID=3242681 RepID=UPI0035C15FF5